MTDVFRDVISHIINQCDPRQDTKSPPAAQRKQAKRACLYEIESYESHYKSLIIDWFSHEPMNFNEKYSL